MIHANIKSLIARDFRIYYGLFFLVEMKKADDLRHRLGSLYQHTGSGNRSKENGGGLFTWMGA
jgi:hypothetical protein